MYNIYMHSYLYICLFVLVLFLVMIVLVFYLVVLILCKSLTRDEGCKLALCYMPYVHGIGCLCVTMPSVLSLLNKQTNKIKLLCAINVGHFMLPSSDLHD